jgi:hypothetical protein
MNAYRNWPMTLIVVEPKGFRSYCVEEITDEHDEHRA